MSGWKRKRIVVSLEMKLKALERIDKGEQVKLICDELGVGKSTINDWRRNRKSLHQFCTQIESNKTLSSRCTLKKSKNEIVDDALWIWFVQKRRRGIPITGITLKEKALMFHYKVYGGGFFSASDGWLSRWKKRHGVHYLGVCSEKCAVDPLVSGEFSKELLTIIEEEGLHPEQIYYLNETGLNFKLLPVKAWMTKKDITPSDLATKKERITVAVCANIAGTHKLPLFVIGKSAQPRAFKHLNLAALPVYYKGQKSAWMDSYLLKVWFFSEFVPKVVNQLTNLKLPTKALLILDNSPTNPSELVADDIKVMFLPPKVKASIQLTDQDVLLSLKRRYRKKLISEIIERTEDSEMGILDALKTINIKDVIYMLARSYEEMPSSTFMNSWRRLYDRCVKNAKEHYTKALKDAPAEDMTDTNVSLLNEFRHLPGCSILEELDIERWLRSDEELENETMNDDEIIDAVCQEGEGVEETANEEEGEEEKWIVSHVEGKDALDIAMRYIEQQKDSSVNDVMFIKKWRDFACKKVLSLNNMCTEVKY